jgi:hypothetical protein
VPGHVIRIFLIDGIASGLRTAELIRFRNPHYARRFIAANESKVLSPELPILIEREQPPYKPLYLTAAAFLRWSAAGRGCTMQERR